jgi:sulfur-oxidizing protein SoxZ
MHATAPIRIHARQRGGATEVQLLMPHPMETGLRRSAAGEPLPAHYITGLAITLGERTVFEARTTYALSRDPLLAFRFGGAAAGQRLRVTWTDNQGQTRSDEAVIT